MEVLKNSSEKIIFPPGETIMDGDKKLEINPKTSGYINFPVSKNSDGKILLPTLVEAEYLKEDEHNKFINIKVLFFVASKAEEIKNSSLDTTSEIIDKIMVKQLFCVNSYGLYTLQLYLYCNERTIEKIYNNQDKNPEYFQAYSVEFSVSNTTINLPENINIEDINIVQSFIWDIDPRTSRGTETVVKGSNGG